MTDNEVIKALECCKDYYCFTCPYDSTLECEDDLKTDALDLINRQKAEIERLKNEIFKWSVQCDAIGDYMNEAVAGARAEAIKEFAERLKAEMKNSVKFLSIDGTYYVIGFDDIDNLVKEMTEPSLLDKKFGGDAE